MKKVFLNLLFLIIASSTLFALETFRDTTLSDSQRIDALIKELTLEEKINLFSTNLGVPRLNIPACNHFEGLHGLSLGGPAHQRGGHPSTIHPQAYGLGETWDTDLVQRIADLSAEEARWMFSQDTMRYHSLVMRAPNADLARDPRWGRTEESFGEDPFLTGAMTVAKVKGLQGDNPRYWKMASLMKHFLANSNEFGRDSTSSEFSERLFHEYYAYPFWKGITDGGSRAFMAAYNRWNGIPMTVHPVFDQVVRPDWDMDGIICTDGGAMRLLMTAHHYVDSLPEAAALIVKAGVGQFLDNYKEALTTALQNGLVTEEDLDKALRGNIKIAIKLGLLDPDPTAIPYYISPDAPKPWETDYAHNLAREATAKSIVMLKNEPVKGKKLLPLNTDKVKRIALVGPYVDNIIQDWYGGVPAYEVTVLDAFRQTFEPMGIQVDYIIDDRMSQAEDLAREADIVFIVTGNHPFGTKADWFFSPVPSDGREAVDRRSLMLPDEDMIRQIYNINPNTVLVLQSSFPYAINWSNENLPAILHFTHSSQETGNGLVDVVTGKVNPAGRTTQTWVKDILDLPHMMDYDITNGRTYMYFEGEPLYPFGYGLSYTSFSYDDIELSDKNIKAEDLDKVITVNVKVTNTGDMDGDEVVQLYASYPDTKDSLRPNKHLRAFQRVSIPMGESVTVPLQVKALDLAKWDENKKTWVLEPGRINLAVGPSSASQPLTTHLKVK